jgi:hypothetical protein
MDIERMRARGKPPFSSPCLMFMTLPRQVENGSFIFIKISAIILPYMQTREDDGMEVQNGTKVRSLFSIYNDVSYIFLHCLLH